MSESIDLNFRPKTYFRPMSFEEYLLSKVKGAVIKRQLRALLDEGRHADVKQLLGDAGISVEDRMALEARHPMFMGGNYLPDTDDGEVEIGRIFISSTTGDVTSVYARPDNGVIRYKVVDEYLGDTLSGVVEMESKEPLTLGEFADFFLKAWSLFEVLKSNFPDDLDEQLEFFNADSDFYPEFDRLCRNRTVEEFAHEARKKKQAAEDCTRESKKMMPADSSILSLIFRRPQNQVDHQSEPVSAAGQVDQQTGKIIWRSATNPMTPGTLCVVTEGDDVAPGVSAGHVVRFIRAPVPGSGKAVFQYAPGEYAPSKSDASWVGKDNAHYCCLIDRYRLRLLEEWESTAAIKF